MWESADIPRSDVHHPTYWTQCYGVLLHHVSLICGRMHVYPDKTFCHNTHVNWLKCFHVTTLNNWWSHIECYLEDSSEIIWWIIFISMSREDMYLSFALNTWCRWWTVMDITLCAGCSTDGTTLCCRHVSNSWQSTLKTYMLWTLIYMMISTMIWYWHTAYM